MIRLTLALVLTLLTSPLIAQPKVSVKADREMVKIPAGRFSPLYRNKSEPRNVKVDAFMMDVTAVTNEEFLRFVIANPQWRRSRVKRIFADSAYLEAWQGDTIIGGQLSHDSPVTSVSWFAARAYAIWAKGELPTIAQWEYAAAQPPQGSTRARLTRLILDWYSKPNQRVLPPVRSIYRNAFGVYDLHGLIWEWTSDFNSVLLSEDDRSKGKDSQMFCGAGAVNGTDFDDYAAYMRYALRSSLSANSVQRNMGFRCVRNLPITKK